MITSYITSLDNSEETPTDTFTVSYEEIKITYTETEDDGSSKGNVEWEFNVESGEN